MFSIEQRVDNNETGYNFAISVRSARRAMPQNPDGLGNQLLDALIGSKRLLVMRMETISLDLRDVLYEPNRPIRNVYFPVSGIVSLVLEVGNGKTVEVATIGNEGFIGVPVFLGADRTQGTAFSQISGRALRISVAAFRDLLAMMPGFTKILNRYVQALLVQIAQGNACNGSHPVEQRCARWLLVTQDRVGQSPFVLTQDFLAQMLGVGRTSVNHVATTLQNAGLIRYSRGLITILDRKGLEARSCQCYDAIRAEFRRMLRDIQGQADQ